MTLKTFMMSSAVAALMAGSAFAQTATTTADPNASATDMTATAPDVAAPQSIEEMTVGQVLGTKVMSDQGEDVGEIDYVISQADGTPAGVIGIGGFLGLGEYTVAMPLSDFTYDPEQNILTVSKSKEELKAIPEFDESDAESLPDDTTIASLMPATPDANATASAGAAATTDTTGNAMGSSDTASSGGATVPPADSGNSDVASTDAAPAATGSSTDTTATDMASTDTSETATQPQDEQTATADTAASDTAQPADAGTDMAASGEASSLETMKVSDAVGSTVLSDSGDDVGKLEYVIQNADAQPEGVIGISDLVGEPDYAVALPLDKFTYDQEADALKVAMTEEELKQAPKFDIGQAETEKLSDDTVIGDVMKDGASAQ